MSLLEKLAQLEHQQWSHWINYMDKRNDSTRWARWRLLASTKYWGLTEEQKESDREWARKTIAIFNEELGVVADKIPSVFADSKHKLLMTNKWNNLESIAEELDVYVTKNKKICIDIVEVQALSGMALDDYQEFSEIMLKALLVGQPEEKKRIVPTLEKMGLFDRKEKETE